MIQAKSGDTVKVHYVGRMDDGTEFDSSRDDDPLEFTIGDGEVITGFENAVIGMSPGDVKTVTIPVDDAYGQYNDEVVAIAERDQFPEDAELEIGQQYEMRNDTGESVVMTIVDVTDTQITLDGNHPLAGEDLTFEIELLEIV
jgi:peptidylprolyl isomerase